MTDLTRTAERNLADFRKLLPRAEKDDAVAQNRIGDLYRDGEGVPKNDAEAVKWYSKAAEQGYAKAQYNLGMMYVLGEGVPQNFVRGYMWWSLAKAQGHEVAAKYMDMFQEEMTPADISKAQALATEMWEKINN